MHRENRVDGCRYVLSLYIIHIMTFILCGVHQTTASMPNMWTVGSAVCSAFNGKNEHTYNATFQNRPHTIANGNKSVIGHQRSFLQMQYDIFSPFAWVYNPHIEYDETGQNEKFTKNLQSNVSHFSEWMPYFGPVWFCVRVYCVKDTTVQSVIDTIVVVVYANSTICSTEYSGAHTQTHIQLTNRIN